MKKLFSLVLVVLMLVATVAVAAPGKHALVGSALLYNTSQGSMITVDYNTVFNTDVLCEAAKDAIQVQLVENGAINYVYADRFRYMMFLDCYRVTL